MRSSSRFRRENSLKIIWPILWHEKQSKTEKLSQTNQKRLGKHENQMLCDILHWILKQKEAIQGKAGEIQIKSNLK